MLPLLAILVITGFKDGLEDLRRHSLDNEVNNSAVTRLGDWNNVNAPDDIRPWWAFWRSSNPNHKLSRGVRKLREKEGSYDAGFLYADQPLAAESRETLGGDGSMAKSSSSYTIDTLGADGGASYPPRLLRSTTLEASQSRSGGPTPSLAHSAVSRKSLSDVVSYDQATPGTAKWERTLWKKLEVGDVILLKENDQIPADVVVLATSDPDGVCFVETKNLDGETNLKPRKALKATMGIANEEDVEHAKFWIDSEPPHANLYSYNGVLRWMSKEERPGMEHPVIEHREIGASQEQEEAITINELLLRGTQLRNTKFVIALVCYTKIMLNQGTSLAPLVDVLASSSSSRRLRLRLQFSLPLFFLSSVPSKDCTNSPSFSI
jgi:phospholipid-translocating ATPase